MKIWRMRIACWIPTATNTQSQYVTLIVHSTTENVPERAPMLRLFGWGGRIIFERKRNVLILSTFVSETFLILRKTEQHMVQHVYRSSCKVPLFCYVLITLESSRHI